MSSIGPQLPPHLQKQIGSTEDEDDDDDDGIGPSLPPSIGPQLPPSVGSGSKVHKEHSGAVPAIPAHISKENDSYSDESEESMGPPRPPAAVSPSRSSSHHRSSKPSKSSSSSRKSHIERETPERGPTPTPSSSSNKRVLGPSFPTYGPTYNAEIYSAMQQDELENGDDDSDDDVGPKPLPSGMKHEEANAVQEFMEREERRRKQLEEASKPKAPKREEWMLVPPSHSDLLGKLDPSKMKKGRQFSKSTAERSSDTSLWTETPAERQKRLEDEVSGKKRRAVDTPVVSEDPAAKRRRQEEEEVRKGVEEYTKSKRGGSLVGQHAATSSNKDTSDEPPVIWDHARDMALSGRLMDDGKRNKMIQEAKGLGSRFSSGTKGGFL